MALTKAAPPSTEITQMANGATVVDIPTPGASIDVDVAGANVATISDTALTVEDTVTATIKNLIGESIALSTTSGAAGDVATSATDMDVGTSSAHPLNLIANAITGLTVGTDGRVTLPVVGTGASQLVDKNYVDTQITAGVNLAATVASTGTITIPTTDTTDLIIKWGISTGVGDRTITFGTAFPNTAFVAFAAPVNTGSPNSDGWWSIDSLATTGFTFNVANKGSYANNVYWLAFGN